MQRNIISLYIHPMQGGPIMPLQWDVPKIYELLGEGLSAEARVEARARELARQIHLRFPKVHPEYDWPKLQHIARNLVFDRFDGIVLQLAGTIAGEAEQTKEEIEKIQEEIKRLHQALQGERQQRLQWQSKAQTYETQVIRLHQSQKDQRELRAENQRLQEEQHTLQNQKASLQGQLNEAQMQVGHYKIQMESLEREHKTQLENLERDLKKKSGREQELRDLRRELQNEQRKNEQLDATIQQLQEELDQLRERSRQTSQIDLFGNSGNQQQRPDGPLIL